MSFLNRIDGASFADMTHTPKLYYSAGSVSMATHMALEEAGVRYELVPVPIKDGQQRTESYRQIHPLGRLPALEVAPGVVLTETPALLGYLADLVPERQLLPTQPLARARANEWMSLFASTLHVTFLSFFRPDRYTTNPAAMAALRQDGLVRFWELLQYVETRLPSTGFMLGESYSLVDPYLTVFHLWATRVDLAVTDLPHLTRIATQVMQRTAVRCALEQEGFGHLYATESGPVGAS
jgi:glutathione S-transferase